MSGKTGNVTLSEEVYAQFKAEGHRWEQFFNVDNAHEEIIHTARIVGRLPNRRYVARERQWRDYRMYLCARRGR